VSVALALLGAVPGKVWLGLAIAAAAVGALLWARKGGERAVESADLKREVADTHTAERIAADVARVPDPRAALDKEFSR
jgi:hypothetical protein